MTETADINVMAFCSKCESAIGKITYEPGECREDNIAGVIIYTSSSLKPRYCKFCGARFKSVFWHTFDMTKYEGRVSK